MIALGVILILVILLYYLVFLREEKLQRVQPSSAGYFDACGTVPLHADAARAWQRYAALGNASAQYSEIDYHAFDAKFLHWFPGYKILYTSGASEGNNMLIRNAPGHVVISAIEHATSLRAVRDRDHSIVACNAVGEIDALEIAKLVKPDTSLISVIHGNNELGTVQNLAALAQVRQYAPHAILHADIVQSYGKLCNQLTDFDVYTISFHKFGGPIGAGAVIYRNDVVLRALIAGEQQNGLRGGTIPLANIAAGAVAIQHCWHARAEKNLHLRKLRAFMIAQISRWAQRVAFPCGAPENWRPAGTGFKFCTLGRADLPHVLTCAIMRAGDYDVADRVCNIRLRAALLRRGFAVSIGSACQTGSGSGSHVLHAIRAPFIVRSAVIRISMTDACTRARCAALMRAIHTELGLI